MKNKWYLPALLLLVALACKPKNTHKNPVTQLNTELFDGNFQVGTYEAIVYPLHRTFEVEMQIFAEPVLFYFDQLDEEGNYIYISDDQSMSFRMKPDHKTGTFHEINEPDLSVVKE